MPVFASDSTQINLFRTVSKFNLAQVATVISSLMFANIPAHPPFLQIQSQVILGTESNSFSTQILTTKSI
jgi:hypothetical protein